MATLLRKSLIEGSDSAMGASMNKSDLSSHLSTTGRLLVRSGIEIGRTLNAMRGNQEAVTATLDTGKIYFASRLLHVDDAQRFIVLRWSDHRPANSVLLAARSAVFHCSHDGIHFEFSSGDPREVHHAGRPAIRAGFPAVMLALHRRNHRRFQVPPELSLRCKIALDGKVHQASITDTSLGGLGMLVYETDEGIDPGTLIEGAIILHPEGERIAVDLEVRHVARVLLLNGQPAFRTGCRLYGKPEDIEGLVSFIPRPAAEESRPG